MPAIEDVAMASEQGDIQDKGRLRRQPVIVAWHDAARA
jgi:hypothetical protein